jgi:competence protein CoiA
LFVAKKNDGGFISLLDRRTRDELVHLRKTFIFYCTACQNPVQLKLGTKRLPHFAHLKDAKCASHAEHETPYHMEGKRQLYLWLSKQGVEVEIESYLSEIKQRPDLLLKDNGEKIAIEYQCSQLTHELLNKRTQSYNRLSIFPIWILGESWLKTNKEPLFEVTLFQWLFATTSHRKNPNKLPFILYFNPITNEITKLTNLIPFSPTHTFATIQRFTLETIQFYEILDTPPSLNPKILKLWLNKKKKWRYQFTMYPDRKLQPLFLALYLARIQRGNVPAEVGVPFHTVYLIETSAVIWQLWILLDSIIPVSFKATISFDDTYQAFKKRVKEGHIKIRLLPNVEGKHYSFAIMEYLQILAKLGILKRIDSRRFIKVKEITIPNNSIEALELDLEVLRKLYTW